MEFLRKPWSHIMHSRYLFKTACLLLLISAFSLNTAAQTAIPSNVCYGAPINLYCGGLTGCGLPGSTYTWSDLVGWNSNDMNPVINPGSPGYHGGTFYLSISYLPTGMSSGLVTLNLLPPMTVLINTTASIVCEGSPVTLTGSGANTYTWDHGVVDGVPFIPTATAIYTVVGLGDYGCTDTARVTVTVKPLPTVTANTNHTEVCPGSQVILTGGGAQAYVWDHGVTDGVPFTPAITNTYTVTGTDANSCSNTAHVSVTVDPVLPVSVSVYPGTNPVCFLIPVTFTANPVNGGTLPGYQWKVKELMRVEACQPSPICPQTTMWSPAF